MSRRHASGPCGMDHDPDLDCTDVHTASGDAATVAALLGLDVHNGRVRASGRAWAQVCGVVALLEDARNATSASLSHEQGVPRLCGHPQTESERHRGAETEPATGTRRIA